MLKTLAPVGLAVVAFLAFFVVVVRFPHLFSLRLQNPPLVRAAEENNYQELKRLLDSGVDVNQRNERGQTALFYALLGRDKRIREELVKEGIDVNAKDEDGETLIDIFHRNEGRFKEQIEWLVGHGADPPRRLTSSIGLIPDRFLPKRCAGVAGQRVELLQLFANKPEVTVTGPYRFRLLPGFLNERLGGQGQAIRCDEPSAS